MFRPQVIHFTSWIAGDLATFEESGNPANTIRVAVASQLDDPVSGTEAISYTFSEIVAGADEAIASSVVSDAHAITVAGQAAPNFTISAVSFAGMTAAGAGQFCIYSRLCGCLYRYNCSRLGL